MRPQDYDRIRKQQDQIARDAGKTITLRKYRGSTAGAPKFGIANIPVISNHNVPAIVEMVDPMEVQTSGGVILAGDFVITSHTKPGEDDKVIIDSVVYDMVSDPSSVFQGNARYWRYVIRRANA